MPFRSRLSLASVLSTSSAPHNKNNADNDPATPIPDVDFDRLPPPVQQESFSDRRNKQKKTRISLGLHVRWDRFLRKLGSGTAPSTSSAIDESSGGSTAYNRSMGQRGAVIADDAEVDDVVVDREWSGEIKSSVHSEHGGTPEKSGSGNGVGGYGGTNTDRDSLAFHVEGFWASCNFLVYLRWRIWPAIHGFFSTHFIDEKSEQHYRKENWFLRKSLALWSAAFFLANWALAIGFIPHPADLSDKIFYYGFAPAFTFPLFFMVVYDFPRDRPMFYQCYLAVSAWSWSCYQVLFMFLCGFYDKTESKFSCENKDFLTTFYYTSAMQTIALFGLGFNRFPALIGVCVFLGMACGMLVPDKHSFIRNVINFVLFQAFLLYVHYMRENAERRLYTLRDQLKIQFRATQKAQVNERKAADSKRRLTSYVFHEVRVPLNTALLAVQNMEASGTVAKEQEIEFKALEGSLSMMSKVLNDVLDFNRMDSGRFESVLKPYAFHQVMRSLFVPLRLATDARGLEFITDLDPNIDEVARMALYEAQGDSADSIIRTLTEQTDEDGIVVGDETRLRQIITNLASNACKFTPTGGKLMITTRLVIPARPPRPPIQEFNKEAGDIESPASERPPTGTSTTTQNANEKETSHGLSSTLLSQHDVLHSRPPPLEWIVVRVEVTDTGCGIRPKDMAQTKLFSAFNQTEMGRQQGGKGTGLGLALVRQIVKRSGGRLGVRSKVNEGSTFWVELPLGIGAKVIAGLTTPDTRASPGERDGMKPLPRPRPNPTPINSAPKPFSPIPTPVADHSRSSSALHSIMEQGGLVEMSTKRGEQPKRLTRTIGDFSTGADAMRTHSSVSDLSTSPPVTPAATQDRPEILTEGHSDTTIRPRHLELPKVQDFAIQETEMTQVVTSPVTPGSVTSGTAMSTNSSNITYESGMRVLVVDDDPLTRKLMTRMLTRLGCKVTTAENGEIALDLILHPGSRPTPSSEDTSNSGGLLDGGFTSSGDEPRYAVVFLDNQMPVMSGLEAVAKLRRRGRRDFVVGVTGNALLTDQEEYINAGVDHVLTKPVLEKSIKSMLAIADERRRQRTPLHDQMAPS